MSYFSHGLSVFEAEKWVKDLFINEEIEIPDLKENLDCLKLLSTIISLSKEAEKDAEETIKVESHLADFYFQKSDEVSHNFSHELLMNELHSDVMERVEKVTAVAVQMKLKEPTVTNFLLCSSSLDNKREFYREQELVDGFALTKFSKKITDVIHKNMSLERDIEILERKVSKQQASKQAVYERCNFLKTKEKEYAVRIKKAEKRLKNLQWNSSISHNELLKRSESVQCLEKKVNDLTQKLESYQNLPPNEMLARFKIEEAQVELLRLQNEFDKLLC